MEFSAANDFSELIVLLKSRGRKSTELSYNQLAKHLGFKSPRLLAMVFKKQRAPSAALVRKVGDYLDATTAEREFLQLLAERSRREISGQPLASLDERIDRFRAMKSIVIQARNEIAGVVIEISPSAPERVSRRLSEIVRELAYEFSDFKKDQVAKASIGSAKPLASGRVRPEDEDRDCFESNSAAG